MHPAATLQDQTNIRNFAFAPMIHKQYAHLLPHITTGLSIVLVADTTTATLVHEHCVKHGIARVNYVHFYSTERALNAWNRLTHAEDNAVLIINQQVYTGWYTHADRIIWIGDSVDPRSAVLEQVSRRIRGKTVQPIILNPSDI